METVTLNSLVIRLESGGREKGGSIDKGIISVGGTHLSNTGGFNWDKKEYVSESFYSRMRSGKIQKDDILIVKDGATTGKISFVDESFPFDKAAINEHVFRLEIDKKHANPKYIFYYLYSSKGQEQILSDFRGATIGGISRGFIDKVDIQLPNLEIQNKIVAILDKAKSLIEKRERTIGLYTKFINNTFIDMFGEPMEQPAKWKIGSIGNYLKEITAGTSYGGQENKNLEDDELGVLKVSAVTKGIFNSSEFKAVKKCIIRVCL